MVQTNSTDNYSTARFIVSATAGQGNYTTIASALAAASSGNTIFLLPGTYTENLSLVAGVNLAAYDCDSLTPNVTIVGKCSFSSAGTVSISGIRLQTNSDYFLSVTGSSASIVNISNCYLSCSNNTGIQYTSSSSSSSIRLQYCYGNLSTTGIALYTSSSSGNIAINYCEITNSGLSTTASENSAGSVYMDFCQFYSPFATSSTGVIGGFYSLIACGSAINAVALSLAGTGSANYFSSFFFDGGSAAAIDCSTSGSTRFTDCLLNSTGGNVVTGTGTFSYSMISFASGSTTSMSVSSSVQLSSLALSVGNGGTGAATLTGVLTGNGTSAVTANAVTQHGVLLGGASNAVSSLGVGATGTVLSGSTGTDPAFTATPTVTSITFGAGTALSNYVQGTWTPVLNFGGATTGITYSQQSGYYTQIGDVVYLFGNIVLSSKGSAVGNATITGAPVALGATNISGNNSIDYFSNLTFDASYTSCFSQITGAGSTTFTLYQIGSGQAVTNLTDTNFSNTTVISFNWFYINL